MPFPDVRPRRQQPFGGGSRVSEPPVFHGQRREIFGQLLGGGVRVGEGQPAGDGDGFLKAFAEERAARKGRCHPPAVREAAEGDVVGVAAKAADVVPHPVQRPGDVQQGKVSGGVRVCSEGGQAVPPEQPQPVVERDKDAARVPHEFAAGQLER